MEVPDASDEPSPQQGQKTSTASEIFFGASFVIFVALFLVVMIASVVAFIRNSAVNTDEGITGATIIQVSPWTGPFIAGGIVVTASAWLIARMRQFALARERLAEERQDIKQLEAETTLPALLSLNRKMLENYHGIAIGQANKSFRSSQIAMWVGYGVVVTCGVAVLQVPETQTKVTVAALGAVGAGLSAFLQRTYLRVYDRSLEQLNRYFDQPLINSHYLTAERILGGSGAQDPALVKRLVEQILSSTSIAPSTTGLSHPAGAKAPRARATKKAAAPADPKVQQIDVTEAKAQS